MITLTDNNQQLDTAKIQTLLGTFEVGIGKMWRFPFPSAGDGRVGKLSVSEHRALPVAGATQNLALHVTFQIPTLTIPSLATVRRTSKIDVNITLENLHLTARPLSSQLTISADGASIIESQISIHRGRTSNWSHTANLVRQQNLARALGLSADPATLAASVAAIDAALASYDGPYLADIAPLLVERIKRKIKDRLNVPSGMVDPAKRPPVKLDALPFNAIVTQVNW